jgi:hypothetical protein
MAVNSAKPAAVSMAGGGTAQSPAASEIAQELLMTPIKWGYINDARHVISMRKCNDREKATYQKRFG